jgi:SAM-dependent methyltransferase
MTSAMGVYSAALRRAASGATGTLRLATADGRHTHLVDTAAWYGGVDDADASVLGRCDGPTLDVGCGPGRLTAALTERGVPALGVDINATAVRLARERGAEAEIRCVFGELPDEGGWQHLLLIDGNLGIGGDPGRLLRRCAQVIAPGGQIMVEVEPPGTPSWHGPVTITHAERTSETFDWSVVGADRLPQLSRRTGLRVAEQWTRGHRWFACLTR